MLYLTSYTNQEYIERAKQTNPFGYLVKPHNQKELHANIEMALHKHRVDKEVNFPWPIAEIALQHRECYDGSGFPRGIKGEDILIEARVLAVAHALEDLTSHRAFRNAFPLTESLETISAHSGSKYDPEVVAACLRFFKETSLGPG